MRIKEPDLGPSNIYHKPEFAIDPEGRASKIDYQKAAQKECSNIVRIASIAASQDRQQRNDFDNQRLELARLFQKGKIQSYNFLSKIHEINLSEEQITRDALTGAYNRRFFNGEIPYNFETARRYNKKLAVIYLDIDHFRKFNNDYGHEMGDQILKIIVASISEQLRSVDVFARIGGEEFAIILPETDKQKATILAERLRAKIKKDSLQSIKVKTDGITISMGVSEYDDTVPDHETLCKQADIALFHSKQNGRDRVTLFKDGMEMPEEKA